MKTSRMSELAVGETRGFGRVSVSAEEGKPRGGVDAKYFFSDLLPLF